MCRIESDSRLCVDEFLGIIRRAVTPPGRRAVRVIAILCSSIQAVGGFVERSRRKLLGDPPDSQHECQARIDEPQSKALTPVRDNLRPVYDCLGAEELTPRGGNRKVA